jgi:hypothetical protein
MFPVLALWDYSRFKLIKKCNGKHYGVQCGSFRALLVLFLSKSMFSFQVLMTILSKVTDRFVDALKDRMSLYSADLLRSDFYPTGSRSSLVIYKK